jgi:hypothetical protein
MTVGLVKMICERDYGEDARRSNIKPDVRVFHVRPLEVWLIQKGMEARGYSVTTEKV